MSASIPDGISFSDLQALVKDAPEETTIVPTGGPYNGMTEEELKDLTDTFIDKIIDANSHPMLGKAIAWRILNHFMEWHTAAGMKQIEDGEAENGMYWLRDAGKFQAIGNLLQTINVGPHDFITPVE